MIAEIAYYMILGQPVVVYMGIFALTSLLVTALIQILRRRAIANIPLEWHIRMAWVTLGLAILHAVLIVGSRI